MRTYALIAVLAAIVLGGVYMMVSTGTYGQLSREGGARGEAVIVGIIADTHILTRAEGIPPEVFTVFENASHIIHAGDFVEPSVEEKLEIIAPVTGVHGNMDSQEIKKHHPKINSLGVRGWKIGVVHDGIPLLRRFRLEKLAEERGFDVLIFGHTHRSSIRQDGSVLYLNPGSPTQPLLSRASVAIMNITGGVLV